MGRTIGDALFSANFEPRKGGPLDARTVVDSFADLLLEASWDTGDGNSYVYKGMVVAVVNDATAENNGVYSLDDLDYTLPGSWRKMDGDVAGPETNTNNNVPQWDGVDSKKLKDGLPVVEQWVAVPDTPTSTGIKGQKAYGGNYLYECVAANIWVRSAVESTWS